MSTIVDIQVLGAKIWQNGKFTDFLKNTTYEPATGYPIPEKDHDDHDIHGDDDDDTGLSSLGGGSEFRRYNPDLIARLRVVFLERVLHLPCL